MKIILIKNKTGTDWNKRYKLQNGLVYETQTRPAKNLVADASWTDVDWSWTIFGFSKLAKKNSKRIAGMPVEKPCIFAFQEWHSYPLVLFMIALGLTLRKFTPIPKPLLGILYVGIGGGLGSASFHYYKSIWKSIFNNQ